MERQPRNTGISTLCNLFETNTDAQLIKVELDKFKYNDCQRRNFIPDDFGISMRTPFISRTKSDARLGKIPKRTSLLEFQFKPRASLSTTFTGRKDYLTKLRDFFSSKPDEPIRWNGFLQYRMGGIEKTQICLTSIEENSDGWSDAESDETLLELQPYDIDEPWVYDFKVCHSTATKCLY
jgi:hypothetical protein